MLQRFLIIFFINVVTYLNITKYHDKLVDNDHIEGLIKT